jgi:hypothetical protein
MLAVAREGSTKDELEKLTRYAGVVVVMHEWLPSNAGCLGGGRTREDARRMRTAQLTAVLDSTGLPTRPIWGESDRGLERVDLLLIAHCREREAVSSQVPGSWAFSQALDGRAPMYTVTQRVDWTIDVYDVASGRKATISAPVDVAAVAKVMLGR